MQTEEATTAKRGRPTLPPHLRRTEVMTFRLSPTERESAYDYAKRRGEPLDTILRRILMHMAVRKPS